MPPTVRHLRGRSVFLELGSRFDDLAATRGAPVTARRRWLQAWIDAYPDWEPWLVVVEDGAILLGVAALARQRRWARVELALLGHGPSDEGRLLARTPSTATLLAEGIRAGLPTGTRWRLRLEQLPVADPVAGALRGLLAPARIEPADGMPLVRITTREIAPYVSKNTRRAATKAGTRLRQQGLVPQWEWITDPGRAAAVLPELMAVHRERDRSLGRRADHDDPRAAAFYRRVVASHAAAGEIDLLTLRLRGELAAYALGFRDGRVLRMWDNRLSPRWNTVSAGRLTNTQALRHVITGADYDALDWMRGEEPWKLSSATEIVPTENLTAWSSPALQRGYDAAMALHRAARRLRRRSPLATRLLYLVRSVRSGGPAAGRLPTLRG